MDPLSVTSGVVGILSASGQLITTLWQLASDIKDAASDANAVVIELSNISVVVKGLQKYILGQSQAPPQRLQLITVEHITATLTGCILTYSELDEMLKSLHVDTGMTLWSRTKWLLKKDKIVSLTSRLQNHKATFTMMLNILQSASMSEAEQKRDRLCDTVDEILRSNRDLASRLSKVEELNRCLVRTLNVRGSISTGSHRSLSSRMNEPLTGTSSDGKLSDAALTGSCGEPASPFEKLLKCTRVYRHAANNTSRFSYDTLETNVFSLCSSLTLGEVSNISVYALPVFAAELSNAACYTVQRPISVKRSIDMIKTSWKSYRAARQDRPPSPATQLKNLIGHPQLIGGPAIDVEKLDDIRANAEEVMIKDAPPIFGVPLEDSVYTAYRAVTVPNWPIQWSQEFFHNYIQRDQGFIYGFIPTVMSRCGEYLKSEGLSVEHIFDFSDGNHSDARLPELRSVFESAATSQGRSIDWVRYTVQDVAALLLLYLKQLPHPLIPIRNYEAFHRPFSSDPSESFDSSSIRVHEYKSLIFNLPKFNRFAFLYMLDLLAMIAKNSDVNKMTSARLANIFLTVFFDHPDHPLTSAKQATSRGILIYLINNQSVYPVDMGGPVTSIHECDRISWWHTEEHI